MIKTFWQNIQTQLQKWKDDNLAPKTIDWQLYEKWDKVLDHKQTLTKWFTKNIPDVDGSNVIPESKPLCAPPLKLLKVLSFPKLMASLSNEDTSEFIVKV